MLILIKLEHFRSKAKRIKGNGRERVRDNSNTTSVTPSGGQKSHLKLAILTQERTKKNQIKKVRNSGQKRGSKLLFETMFSPELERERERERESLKESENETIYFAAQSFHLTCLFATSSLPSLSFTYRWWSSWNPFLLLLLSKQTSSILPRSAREREHKRTKKRWRRLNVTENTDTSKGK